MGQHGNHPVHQVNTGPPLQGLPVQGRILLNIICHVCNVNSQAVFFPIKGDAHSIVQILGILAVNGHHFHIPQIPAAGHVCLGYLLRHPFHLVHNLDGKFHWQLISPHNGQDVHPRIVHMPQDFRYFPFRTPLVRSVIRNLHYHFVAAHGALGALPGHKNIPGQSGVIRYYKSVVLPASVVGTHHLSDPTGYNPYYLCLLPPALLLRKQRHFHRILMVSSVCLLLRNI